MPRFLVVVLEKVFSTVTYQLVFVELTLTSRQDGLRLTIEEGITCNDIALGARAVAEQSQPSNAG